MASNSNGVRIELPPPLSSSKLEEYNIDKLSRYQLEA